MGAKMVERFVQKRNVFTLLLLLSITVTTITALLGWDYFWWFRASLFFAATTLVGIYIGQLSTAYKVRHALESKVDDLLNDLATPKLENLADPALERGSFLQFGRELLALLCEDFNYQAGLICLFEKSLKPTYRQTYYHNQKATLSLTHHDYKLYHELCRKDPSSTISLFLLLNDTYSIQYSKKAEIEDRKLDDKYHTIQFKHLKLLPISLNGEYLGFIGLFHKTKSAFLDNVLDFVKIVSEKAILQEIENKKIDDSMKNFLFRQLLLQVILTLRYLDHIHNGINLITNYNELAGRIIRVIRDCWNFNACVIKHVDGNFVEESDSTVDMQIVKSKLIPRIDQRLAVEKQLHFYEENAAQLCSLEETPGFESALALKLQKEDRYFGYLLVMANRELSTFEKQALAIFEDYKIDDCYWELTQKLSNKM